MRMNPPRRKNLTIPNLKRLPLSQRLLSTVTNNRMPKPIARRKTKKAVAKRFKITATGKVMTSQSGRRHLAGSKNRKRKRHLAKMKQVHHTDEYRIKSNLPFA